MSFKCNSCEREFGQKVNFNRHFKTVHENIKSYKCVACEKMFGQKAHMNSHYKSVHENIKQSSHTNGTLVKNNLENK